MTKKELEQSIKRLEACLTDLIKHCPESREIINKHILNNGGDNGKTRPQE